ncbi:hypothetical protein CupriaWKF_11425 [Cupriavidus sp. WKF15]|uniref:hypothetical protein n=1 Tax=Cupriavidus sp. WKF15 TaxID=3032282 RepID=UPI0023E2F51A|nr:hypothetical protein [Cupriavidus sp. WKF15]WER44934.1 hypothetical protein CupriaWKF_11425 [Cupriavidus sp. WKF15]
MNKITFAAAILCVAAGSANTACFGSQNMYTCTDNSGNSYNVNRARATTATKSPMTVAADA